MLCACLLAACDGRAAIRSATAGETDPTQRTFGFNLKLTHAGELRADVFGDTAFQRPNSTITEIRNVRLTFFSDSSRRPSNLTARTGEYDPASEIMVARGNVVLITTNDEGERRVIRSEELHYDRRGDRVWSERETSIEEPDGTLYSDGFTSDTRFTNVRGKNSRTVRGSGPPPGGVPGAVTPPAAVTIPGTVVVPPGAAPAPVDSARPPGTP